MQFVLGPASLDGYPTWRRMPVAGRFVLTAHPDLGVTVLSRGTYSLTLLGYAIDPFRPTAGNVEILAETLTALHADAELFDVVEPWGGRWALIVDDGRTVKLLHDAMGLRPVFYTDAQRTRDLWCASQPTLVAQILRLPLRQDVIDLVRAIEWTDQEHWLPGGVAPYDGMKQLMPNHFLDLRSGESRRYWPTRELSPVDFEEGVQRSIRTLRGLLEGVAHRYRPSIGMTAGRDCRVVLAAFRGIPNATYVTVKKPNLREFDVAIPARLLSALGLKHDIIAWPASVDEQFASAFSQNAALPHPAWIPEAQACLEYSGLAQAAVTGAGGSAPKRYYAPKEDDSRGVTAERLSHILGTGSHPFAVASFGQWLAGVADIHRPDAWDLVHWEQRCGSWLAMCQQEYDVAWQEIFTPYNCRRLLADMMAVEDRLRTPPAYALHQEIMRRLWPEVLSQPILPWVRPSLMRRAMNRAARTIKSLR
jgi:hypothetical protein